MSAAPTLLDPDELLAMPDGDRYELIDGIPVEKAVGAESDYIALAIARLFREHCLDSRQGLAFGDTGYRCSPTNPQRVRRPDASVILAGRLPNDRPPKGFITIAPDLAAEVISPNDLYEEVEEKVNEYLAAGVRLVWVVSPGSKTVLVRRPDGTAVVVGPDGELSGEGVLPGFACKVADLFV